ncbi:1-deoxy-D-xylulose-5-phosphate synthase [Lachnospiraceae bacterium oral taxon 096]|nr:1-deoxy-D-xylulose-5-phosphate synthase [Lachnospiraceae bacterium oral taxon 096]QUI95780.1 1-deoxy-D-xylulose-5-phosphate synthase [Lachnospiraceae bacterium oral taxon 096]
MVLEKIKNAEDIKKLKRSEYRLLAQEIREFLIEKLSVTGGHLASNLGVVELTMALYLSFDFPRDQVVWDVGHQSYTHKILSGRMAWFDELRKFGGMSGFPKRKESPFDAFDTGHSSTSISAGLGLAKARDVLGENKFVVSVIGDGALTGGMAYEALNNAAQLKNNFIIVLNDNNMSIAPNVGGMSQYLGGMRTKKGYTTLKKNVVSALNQMPVIGKRAITKLKKTKNGIKQMVIPGMLFENMGLTYLGPVDGHNILQMMRIFQEAKRLDHAVLVHVITKKGKGYAPAENAPSEFHGVGPFDIVTGKSLESKKMGYTEVFSNEICALARRHSRLVAITAAMPGGTGLSHFAKEFPERFVDVGIAEEHAVTCAAGMAVGGLLPVFAVYSSFLQRGFDQVVHDVCIQNLHVVFAIDRAGLVGADGETHQGLFDLSYLGIIPNMVIMAPKNSEELKMMLRFAVEDYQGPIALRYPRGVAYEGFSQYQAPIVLGRAEMMEEEEQIALFALGSMVTTAEHLREKLKKKGYRVSLVNARFAKPVDFSMIDRLLEKHQLLVTMEENVLRGGMGEAVADYIAQRKERPLLYHVTLPDDYVEHGDVTKLKSYIGVDSDSIAEHIIRIMENR